jgi:hypothetical protein
MLPSFLLASRSAMPGRPRGQKLDHLRRLLPQINPGVAYPAHASPNPLIPSVPPAPEPISMNVTL